MTFGQLIEEFLTGLRLDVPLPDGFEVLQPYANPAVRYNIHEMCARYYADAPTPRIPMWGINPGRLGGGVTGLSFTDPHALFHMLRIGPETQMRREPSATFIQMVIEAYGGAEPFYRDVFLSAISPLGFIKDGNNINFYDDPGLCRAIVPFVLESVRTQSAAGLRTDACIVLGSGKLRTFVEREVVPVIGYKRVVYLDHPRFVMQYRRKAAHQYVEQYVSAIESLA